LNDEIVVPDHIRKLLKKPLGLLIPGPPGATRSEVEKIVGRRTGKLVAVGDAVAKELLAIGARPDVCIVDGRIERRPVERIEVQGAKELVCRNRPGTISAEAYRAVRDSLSMNCPVVLRVEGEEDLLGLVVMVEAPTGTLMLYGQPRAGVVVVQIDEEAKMRGRSLIEASSQR